MSVYIERIRQMSSTHSPTCGKSSLTSMPALPYFLKVNGDFINALISEFTPLAGDRKFGEDEALMGGFGRFRGESICVIGQEKGATTESRIKHNFGMARPEGYRKAVRLMEMADRFGIPVLSIVDSAGAYPGIGAEERGQAEAIARSTDACLSLGVPNVAIITGEGMSGGAIAITTANRVLMFEHAIYSVISPEGAASILWRDTTKAQDAATNMKITAPDLMRFGVIDEIFGLLFENRKKTLGPGMALTWSELLPFSVDAWSGDRSSATSSFPFWMLISCAGAWTLRTTTVL